MFYIMHLAKIFAFKLLNAAQEKKKREKHYIKLYVKLLDANHFHLLLRWKHRRKKSSQILSVFINKINCSFVHIFIVIIIITESKTLRMQHIAECHSRHTCPWMSICIFYVTGFFFFATFFSFNFLPQLQTYTITMFVKTNVEWKHFDKLRCSYKYSVAWKMRWMAKPNENSVIQPLFDLV